MFNLSAERSNWEDERSKLVWLPHKRTYEFASKLCENKNVLEVGCGEGWGSNLIAGFAKKVTAIDIDNQAISYAKKKFNRNNLFFRKLNIYNLKKINHKFDIVVSFQVIEHLKDIDSYLSNIKEKLTKNGILIISTPNKSSNHVKSPYHFNEYTKKEIIKILQKYFNVHSVYGLYADKKIFPIINTRKKYNKLLLKIDPFNLIRFIPLRIQSVIFALGSRIVGFILQQNDSLNFNKINTNNFLFNKNVTREASDIVVVCM